MKHFNRRTKKLFHLSIPTMLSLHIKSTITRALSEPALLKYNVALSYSLCLRLVRSSKLSQYLRVFLFDVAEKIINWKDYIYMFLNEYDCELYCVWLWHWTKFTIMQLVLCRHIKQWWCERKIYVIKTKLNLEWFINNFKILFFTII